VAGCSAGVVCSVPPPVPPDCDGTGGAGGTWVGGSGTGALLLVLGEPDGVGDGDGFGRVVVDSTGLALVETLGVGVFEAGLGDRIGVGEAAVGRGAPARLSWVGVCRRNASVMNCGRRAELTVGVGIGLGFASTTSLSLSCKSGNGSTTLELTGPPARLTLTSPPYSMHRAPNA
jgi:hypothetical protein